MMTLVMPLELGGEKKHLMKDKRQASHLQDVLTKLVGKLNLGNDLSAI